MSTEYKPLFNRTYLKVIPWIVAIVIIVLSANDSSDFPTPEAIDNSSGFVFEDENASNQVIATYPLAPAFSLSHQVDKQALQEIYSDNFVNTDLEVTWEQDRVIVSFPLTKTIVSSLRDTLNSAAEYSPETYNNEYAKAKAAQYLSMNIPEELAIANFKNHLPENYRTQFSPFNQQPTVLFIVKKRNNKLIKQTLEQLKADKRMPKSDVVMDTGFAPQQIALQGRSEQFVYLLGQTLEPNDSHSEQLIALYYLHHALQNLNNAKEVTYRIQRKPLKPLGYNFLMVSAKRNFDNNALLRLKNRLLDTITEDDLESIKKRLVKQYETQISTAEAKHFFFARQLFYGDKIQSPKAFHDTLTHISLEQVKEQIALFLNPDSAIVVNLTPL